jgi:3-phosphoshikimate 1-carboxyvinyltransferase
MPDMVPTLAVTAAFAEGTTVIRNVGHLRIKESDRLQAVAEGLQRLGVQVNEGRDSLTIRGGSPVGALIDPHDDHRIAMSFAIAGLVTRGVRIADETCVDKSFPEFWDRFKELYSSSKQ